MTTKIFKSGLILVSYENLPEPLRKYVEGVSKTTGIPINDIINSVPVKRYIKSFGYKLKEWETLK